MKPKFIFILLLVITMFLFPNLTYAGIIEDQLAKQNLSDLKILAKELKQYHLQAAKALLKAYRSLNRAANNEFQCSKTKGENLLNKMEAISEIIQKKACSNASQRIFTPRYEHCTSAADLKCVCSHKEHKDEPQCAQFVKDKKEENKDKCIPDDQLSGIVNRFETIVANLKLAFLTDNDANDVSDICEDNL